MTFMAHAYAYTTLATSLLLIVTSLGTHCQQPTACLRNLSVHFIVSRLGITRLLYLLTTTILPTMYMLALELLLAYLPRYPSTTTRIGQIEAGMVISRARAMRYFALPIHALHTYTNWLQEARVVSSRGSASWSTTR